MKALQVLVCSGAVASVMSMKLVGRSRHVIRKAADSGPSLNKSRDDIPIKKALLGRALLFHVTCMVILQMGLGQFRVVGCREVFGLAACPGGFQSSV